MNESTSKKEIPKIFISYCWKDGDTVDSIDSSFRDFGLILERDIRDAPNYTSIKDFMKKIKYSDYVILIISDSYMKSQNCMFEILELLKKDDYKYHIFPILLRTDISNIYSNDALIKYSSFWNETYDKLDADSKILRPEEKVEIDSRLRIIGSIKQSIGIFIDTLQDLKAPSFEDLTRTNYRAIREVILPSSRYFNYDLFDRCKRCLDATDMLIADEKLNTSCKDELGDWLLEKLKPSNYHSLDVQERIVFLAEIIKEMNAVTELSKKIKEDIVALYKDVVVRNILATEYGLADRLRLNLQYDDGRGDYYNHVRKKINNYINAIIEAARIIGYLKNDIFNPSLFTICLDSIKEADRKEAVFLFDRENSITLGDWLLDKIQDYELLADIIKEIGVSTPKTNETIERIKREAHIAFEASDSEFNGELERQKGYFKRVMEKLNGLNRNQ
jgi:hypothetical protein